MLTRFITITTALAVTFAAAPASADWDVGDPFKMHFPQLPDPTGWDIDVTAGNVVADDWLCTGTGPVDDIHFWYSWERDVVGFIDQVHVSIHEDTPAVVGQIPFSRPGDLLWERDFVVGEFTTRFAGSGDQGFFDAGGGWIRPDHQEYYQLNIVDIIDPFIQQADTIYWLDISILLLDPVGSHIGWKTSLDQFQDDAVFLTPDGWVELIDPFTGQSLDLAFVITPEPATLALLTLGGLAMLRRRNG